MNKLKLGVIGFGNMATAIISGVLSAHILSPTDIIVSDLSDTNLEYAKTLGLNITTDNTSLANSVEYLLLAVKPQGFSNVIKSINNFTTASVVISIMAGITTTTISNSFSNNVEVARIMPNTPCFIGQGTTGLYLDKLSTDENKQFVTSIFSSLGKVVIATEDSFNAVSAISGSGPAYIYTFIKAMISAGVEIGLSFEQAKQLTLGTAIGSTNMMNNVNTIEEIDILINSVCSKGGSTIEAIEYYQSNNLHNIIVDGITKCRNKNIILSKVK